MIPLQTWIPPSLPFLSLGLPSAVVTVAIWPLLKEEGDIILHSIASIQWSINREESGTDRFCEIPILDLEKVVNIVKTRVNMQTTKKHVLQKPCLISKCR